MHQTVESGLVKPIKNPHFKHFSAKNRGFYKKGWMTRFEPATSGSTDRRSNQLSYIHHKLIIYFIKFRRAFANRRAHYLKDIIFDLSNAVIFL